eukprot:1157596-Pelagomonas_calceolata.AAC.1
MQSRVFIHCTSSIPLTGPFKSRNLKPAAPSGRMPDGQHNPRKVIQGARPVYTIKQPSDSLLGDASRSAHRKQLTAGTRWFPERQQRMLTWFTSPAPPCSPEQHHISEHPGHQQPPAKWLMVGPSRRDANRIAHPIHIISPCL